MNQFQGVPGPSQAAFDALRQGVTPIQAMFDTQNAGSHNSIYRGKSLGSSVTAAQWAAIKNGTFDDMYIGDYWLISNVYYYIAGFNYWSFYYGVNDNHIAIVPGYSGNNAFGSTTMDGTSGYANTSFFKGSDGNTSKAGALAVVNNAFGSAHILQHKELLSIATSNGVSSNWDWIDSKIELMSEPMVCGSMMWGNVYDVGIDTQQLPLFRLNPEHICLANGRNYWLRGYKNNFFSYVSVIGSIITGYNLEYAIRPVFAIYQA